MLERKIWRSIVVREYISPAISQVNRMAVRSSIALSSRRLFHHSIRLCAVSDADFHAAKDRVATLTQDPGNDVKLKMYGLYKQATIGPCNAPKPGAFDFVGKAKWAAWNELGSITQDEAKQQYINTVRELSDKESKYMV